MRLNQPTWLVVIAGVFVLVLAGVVFTSAWFRWQNDITGEWYHSDGGDPLAPYSETLAIRPDGTFTKEETRPGGSRTLAGYFSMERGIVTFRISSWQCIPAWPDISPLNVTYRCRYTREWPDRLVIDELDPIVMGEGIGHIWINAVQWHGYTRKRH